MQETIFKTKLKIDNPVFIPQPKEILIELTKLCNLRCSHCSYSHDLKKSDPNGLNWEQWIKVMEKFKFLGAEKAVIIGGEPTIFPDFEKVLDYAQDNFETIVETNATTETKFSDYPKVVVAVSLESPFRYENTKIRGKVEIKKEKFLKEMEEDKRKILEKDGEWNKKKKKN